MAFRWRKGRKCYLTLGYMITSRAQTNTKKKTAHQSHLVGHIDLEKVLLKAPLPLCQPSNCAMKSKTTTFNYIIIIIIIIMVKGWNTDIWLSCPCPSGETESAMSLQSHKVSRGSRGSDLRQMFVICILPTVSVGFSEPRSWLFHCCNLDKLAVINITMVTKVI